jgi:hypothetical protein
LEPEPVPQAGGNSFPVLPQTQQPYGLMSGMQNPYGYNPYSNPSYGNPQAYYYSQSQGQNGYYNQGPRGPYDPNMYGGGPPGGLYPNMYPGAFPEASGMY